MVYNGKPLLKLMIFVRSKHLTCLVKSPKRNPPAKKSTHPSLQEPPNTTSQPKCVKKWRPGDQEIVLKKTSKKQHISRVFLFRLVVLLRSLCFFRCFALQLGSTALMIETPPPGYPSCKAEQNYKFFGYRMIFHSTNQNELHNTN